MAQQAQTGAAIIEQCQRAYDTLSSYSCHSDATASGIGAAKYKADADIKFVRPGQISISGNTMFGTPYSLSTDGTSVTLFANGSAQSPKDFNDGLAYITGISQGAGTVIPAILMHTQWGNPFVAGRTVSNDIITQNVNGQPCYMVILTSPIKQAFWIDKQTFLIDQVASKINMGVYTFRQLQTITNSTVNPTGSTNSLAGQ